MPYLCGASSYYDLPRLFFSVSLGVSLQERGRARFLFIYIVAYFARACNAFFVLGLRFLRFAQARVREIVQNYIIKIPR